MVALGIQVILSACGESNAVIASRPIFVGSEHCECELWGSSLRILVSDTYAVVTLQQFAFSLCSLSSSTYVYTKNMPVTTALCLPRPRRLKLK